MEKKQNLEKKQYQTVFKMIKECAFEVLCEETLIFTIRDFRNKFLQKIGRAGVILNKETGNLPYFFLTNPDFLKPYIIDHDNYFTKSSLLLINDKNIQTQYYNDLIKNNKSNFKKLEEDFSNLTYFKESGKIPKHLINTYRESDKTPKHLINILQYEIELALEKIKTKTQQLNLNENVL